MILGNAHLQHFRSFEDETFEFDPGVNIVIGANGSGKTSLLEAVLVCALGSSYRAPDAQLLTYGEAWARIDMQADTTHRIVKLVRQENDRIAKVFDIDAKVFKRLTLQHTLPVVIFEPDHLQMLSGSPERRREYIDGLLEQTVSGYGALRRNYRRTLAQRNALLKHGRGSVDQLFAWNIRLSELGGLIAEERRRLIHQLNETVGRLYSDIAGSEYDVTLHYKTSCEGEPYGSIMLKKLEAGQYLDWDRGFTAYGPHRDDVEIMIEGHPVMGRASRGEARTLLLSLKVLELRVIEQVRDKKPLLLLDDVFSELDGARRRALTEVIAGYQTFITTTDADVVVQHFMQRCNIIPLER